MKFSKEQIEQHVKWANNACWSGLPNWLDWMMKSQKVIVELLAQNELYRETLEFYADYNIYVEEINQYNHEYTLVEIDEGKKAREAIKGN